MRALLVLLLALCAQADILIGDKPCLWKHPITQLRGYPDFVEVPEPDLPWNKTCGRISKKYRPSCEQEVKNRSHGYMATQSGSGPWKWTREVYPLDTVSWETYWDSCKRGNK